MPDPIDYDDELEDDEMTDPDADDRTPAGLRRAAKEGKAARAEANRLARENAMLKAGIDTETPLGAMFADGYKGELTKDAVKAAWAALGVAPSTAEPADDPVVPDVELSDEERNSTAERQALSNGSVADTPAAPDPRSVAHTAADSVISAGGTTDDALAAMLNVLVGAAVDGDKRVLIENPNLHRG